MNADGSFFAFISEMSLQGLSASEGECILRDHNIHTAGCVSIQLALCFWFDAISDSYSVAVKDTCIYDWPCPYRIITSPLNTSRPGAPSGDLSQSSPLYHLPSCVHLLCHSLRDRALERWALARAGRSQVGGRSTRASSGLGTLFAWLGR